MLIGVLHDITRPFRPYDGHACETFPGLSRGGKRFPIAIDKMLGLTSLDSKAKAGTAAPTLNKIKNIGMSQMFEH